jgi:hypothetical protein
MLKQIAKVKASFPKLPDTYFDILRERLEANGFTDERLTDAVNYVIDNFTFGQEPNIANFISYDQRVKFYHYHDMIKMNDQMPGSFNWGDYQRVLFPNTEKPVFVHVNDIVKYNLNRFKA